MATFKNSPNFLSRENRLELFEMCTIEQLSSALLPVLLNFQNINFMLSYNQ